MSAHGLIRVDCGTRDDAGRLLAAIVADDDLQCKSRLEGTTVVSDLEGHDVASLLRAADDLLACLAVAQDVARTK